MGDYFWSYCLVFLGSLAVTVSLLGRFVYRGQVRFDLDGLLRFGLFVLGVGILVGAVLLYAYQFELQAYWASATPTPTLTPTPTPVLTVTPGG